MTFGLDPVPRPGGTLRFEYLIPQTARPRSRLCSRRQSRGVGSFYPDPALHSVADIGGGADPDVVTGSQSAGARREGPPVRSWSGRVLCQGGHGSLAESTDRVADLCVNDYRPHDTEQLTLIKSHGWEWSGVPLYSRQETQFYDLRCCFRTSQYTNAGWSEGSEFNRTSASTRSHS